MGIPIKKILSEFPKERQEIIKAKANEYIRDFEKLQDESKPKGLSKEIIVSRPDTLNDPN